MQNDVELLSQINTDMTISIDVIFKRLLSISNDENLIISLLEKCKLCDLQNENTIVKIKVL